MQHCFNQNVAKGDLTKNSLSNNFFKPIFYEDLNNDILSEVNNDDNVKDWILLVLSSSIFSYSSTHLSLADV